MQPGTRTSLGSAVELDAADESLIIDGTRVPLRPKVYAVLRYLIENPGRIVTKDELLDEVWADTVVGDSVLKVCIRELRSKLGDDTREPRFIATAHRRGYRYVGECQPVGATPQATPDSESSAANLAKETVSTSTPHDSLIVAREAELAVLEHALAEASCGRRQTVFVSGSAGIGKTAVLSEALRRFAQQGHVRVVRGRCQETAGAKEPYLPFLECLNELFVAGQGAEQLKQIAPTWLVQFPWLIVDEDRDALERRIHGATQARMLREFDVFLAEATRDEVLVLALEDLHWSDGDSVSLLSFLATRDAAAKVLIIATTRSVELIVEDHPLRAVRRELTRHPRYHDLPLEFLDAQDVQQLVARRLGGPPVSAEIAELIHGRTEGQPLFIVHLLDHLIAEGRLTSTESTWSLRLDNQERENVIPRSLPAFFQRSFEQCTDEEQRALEVGSLAGEYFSIHAVANGTGFELEHAEAICERVAERGDLLVALSVSDLPDGSISMQYRFTHALVRDSLRRMIAPARRVRFQRGLAERGEALFGEQIETLASQFAVHFEEARIPDRAIHYYRMAARNALRRLSTAVAIQQLLKAKEIAVRVLDLPAGIRRALEYDLAHALRASGDFRRAAEVYESLAQSSRKPEESAEGWLLAAGCRSWEGRAPCLENASQAMALSEAISEPAVQAHIEGFAAYWRVLWDGWDPDARASCEAALESAETSGRANHQAAHRARLAFFLALEGRCEAASGAARDAHEEAIRIGDASEGLLARFYGGLALILWPHPETAREYLTRAQEEAALNGHLPWAALFSIQRAWLAVETGERTAPELARGAVAQAAPLDIDFVTGFASAVSGLSAVANGDAAEAHRCFAKCTDSAYLLDWFCRLLTLVGRVRLGDSAAQAELRKQAEAMDSGRFLEWSRSESC